MLMELGQSAGESVRMLTELGQSAVLGVVSHTL